jgi:X-Pro dipeptidyl-peptidase
MRAVVAAVLLAAFVWPAPVPTRQRFVNGLAQPDFEGQPVVRHDVWVEIPELDSDRDGVNDRIRAHIARPAATDRGTKLPIVLTASPYSGGTRPYPRHDLERPLFVPGRTPVAPAPVAPSATRSTPVYGNESAAPAIRASRYETYFLPRGFIFAYANSLGTGHSTGCPTIGGREENLAIKALIDWFNGTGTAYDASGQRAIATWTTGATAMIGVSYDGTLPIGAATLNVAGLKAIVPIAGVSSYYDHRRSYGTVINSFPTAGTDADTLFDNILSRHQPDACAFMRERIAGEKDRETGDYNAFWEERDYPKAIGPDFRAAVLISHGLNDFNTKPRHAARLWASLKAARQPAAIWWNRGGHGDRPLTARRDAWFDALNRFWTRHLFGVQNGVERDPRVVVEREDNTWVTYADWPHPDARPVTWRLVPSGDNGFGGLVTTAAAPSGSRETIVDNSAIDANELVAAPSSPHRLVYRSAPLTAPVHVSGIPEVSLYLAFDKPAAIVSAMLVEYRADGTAGILTRGWADPQNRESLTRTTPVTPGETYRIAFELQPHDVILKAGSRLGLAVLSSDRLFTQRPPPGTTLTLDVARSTFVLPIVGGLSSRTATR